MSQEFLAHFLKAALEITQAERGFAVDESLDVQALINLDEAVLQSPDFADLAFQALQNAIRQRETVLTNNVITDPAQAPITNTNFSDLRVIVAIPAIGIGAIYLDQHIRNGIIPREQIEKLRELASRLIGTNHVDMSDDEMVALFQRM